MKNSLVSIVIVSKDRKKDLVECIDSFLKSSYKRAEIIVVDNGSTYPLTKWLPKKYPKLKLITSNKNLGAAGGRNLGLANTKGKYILFSDDDAYADKNMIKYLAQIFNKKHNAGVVQPLVYDKDRPTLLQGAGHDINLTTGRIKAWGVGEVDNGQYDGLREVPMCGCVWMVKREVFDSVGDYDQDYFIPYEDSDFSLRARKAGFKLYCYSKAKTYHQGVKITFVNPLLEFLGITSAERAYRIARNKIIFMVKHSKFPNNLLFFCLLFPMYIISHSIIILTALRVDVLIKYWKGVGSGLNYLGKKLFNKLTIIILAWTDPLPWMIDKNGQTILDLGCGEGLPLRLIKERHKISQAVGIDLFEQYIQKARYLQTHDKYFIKDIREIDYKKKSFDIVLASHILEHLKKNEALKLLSKMEKIASKQIIVAAPIGEIYHHESDGNILQLYLSALYPDEFKARGYQVIRYGWRWLIGEGGLIDRWDNIFMTELCFIIHLFSTPIFYIFPNIGTYTFVASKKVGRN